MLRLLVPVLAALADTIRWGEPFDVEDDENPDGLAFRPPAEPVGHG